MSEPCPHLSADGLFDGDEEDQLWWCWGCSRIFRSEADPEGMTHEIAATYDELRFRISELERRANADPTT